MSRLEFCVFVQTEIELIDLCLFAFDSMVAVFMILLFYFFSYTSLDDSQDCSVEFWYP